MKIIVDREACISAADCVAIAPKTFELDEEGKARVIGVDGDDQETILEAVKSCPVACIYIFDDNGKQVWPETGSPPPALLKAAGIPPSKKQPTD